jgi:hypothetical protein
VSSAGVPRRSVLTVATFVLAGAWAVLGWLLLTGYRPGSSAVSIPYQVVGVLLGLAGLVLVVVDRQRLDVVPIAGLGAVAAIAAVMTFPQVLWDSLALTNVATGESIRGIWWPVANAEDVRTLTFAGREVTPAAFRAAVYAHVVSAAAVLMTVPLAALMTMRPLPAPPEDD